MATLGVHRDFLPQYARLQKPVRDRVDEVFTKFDKHTHAGLHLEKITGAKDHRIRTIRITDFYRGVIAHTGETYLLLNVLPHDKAIEWARNRRLTANKVSGGIEVRNDMALATATQGFRRLDAAPSATSEKLFDGVSDADLDRLGIDEEIRTVCRLLRTVDELDSLGSLIPALQYDALAGLAAGLTPEDVWQELAQNILPSEPNADTDTSGEDTLAEAMKRSPGYVVVVNDGDELADILERPFDLWRVFLHPSQKRIAEHAPYRGPARVTGGAGTGKTVVALHRAHHLARQNPDLPEGSILLTTFTKNLAEELARNLDILVTDPVVRARIKVDNIDVIAHRHYTQRYGAGPDFIERPDRLVRWRRLRRKHQADIPESFLDQEWLQIVVGQQIATAEQYRSADRRGRGTALTPTLKDILWLIMAEFTEQLRREQYWAFEEVADVVAEHLRTQKHKPYRHVVVDEAQDLHPSRWRMLRDLVDESSTDNLFIAGDTHQRIYQNKVSLRSLGINVTGRSAKLRINYRTSREILLWSTALLLGERVDDMDEGEENLVGYRSSFRGDQPKTLSFTDKPAEIAGIVEHVQGWLHDGVPAETIGIAARTSQVGKDIDKALHAAGIDTVKLGSKTSQPGVRIGTMHKMKGLEFRCVVVADVGERSVPMPNALTDADIDAQQHQQDLQAERNLLFVACTRARDLLLVTWHGQPSEFLHPVLHAERRGSYSR